MFTGIIEEMGTVTAIARSSKTSSLTISGELIFDDLKLGDSVAVNGVCLTVSNMSGTSFNADVMNETLARSSLGSLVKGSNVNLERAMLLNGRFGGHIVSGHIDGTGSIASIKNDGNAVWYRIETADQIMRYIIEKGSITLEGISLTIAEVHPNGFSVSIIPHTLDNTVLSQRKVGDVINIENDIIGKYVERLLMAKNETGQKQGLTRDFLLEYGF